MPTADAAHAILWGPGQLPYHLPHPTCYEAQGLSPTPSLASSHHVITESLMEMDGVGCKDIGHTHFTVIYCKRKIAKVSHPVVTERLRVRIASDTRSFMGRRRRRRRRCQGRLIPMRPRLNLTIHPPGTSGERIASITAA